MKREPLEWTVGLFMLLGLAATGYLTLKLGAGSFIGADTYLLEARFTNAGGLHAGSSVMLSGVTVGRVETIRINPEDFSAIATLRIRSAISLPTDSMASVKTSGLIGDKYVSLLPGADDAPLAPGERITLTESALDIESLISKMAFGSVEEEASSGTQPLNTTAP